MHRAVERATDDVEDLTQPVSVKVAGNTERPQERNFCFADLDEFYMCWIRILLAQDANFAIEVAGSPVQPG